MTRPAGRFMGREKRPVIHISGTPNNMAKTREYRHSDDFTNKLRSLVMPENILGPKSYTPAVARLLG